MGAETNRWGFLLQRFASRRKKFRMYGVERYTRSSRLKYDAIFNCILIQIHLLILMDRINVRVCQYICTCCQKMLKCDMYNGMYLYLF